MGRLAEDFETWRRRDLADDRIHYLIMDGWYPKVRIGKRRVRVPVLATLGVRADGERVILDVRLAGDESTAAWRDVIRSLVERHVGAPRLAMIDGSAGLTAALREELAEDYRRMIYAETRALVDQARAWHEMERPKQAA